MKLIFFVIVLFLCLGVATNGFANDSIVIGVLYDVYTAYFKKDFPKLKHNRTKVQNPEFFDSIEDCERKYKKFITMPKRVDFDKKNIPSISDERAAYHFADTFALSSFFSKNLIFFIKAEHFGECYDVDKSRYKKVESRERFYSESIHFYTKEDEEKADGMYKEALQELEGGTLNKLFNNQE